MRKWLKEIRLNAKKTMKDIATEADISECYYSQIESGARDASVTVAKKVFVMSAVARQGIFDCLREVCKYITSSKRKNEDEGENSNAIKKTWSPLD